MLVDCHGYPPLLNLKFHKRNISRSAIHSFISPDITMPLLIFLCRNKSEVPSAYPAFNFSPAMNRQRSAHHIEWQRIYCDDVMRRLIYCSSSIQAPLSLQQEICRLLFGDAVSLLHFLDIAPANRGRFNAGAGVLICLKS